MSSERQTGTVKSINAGSGQVTVGHEGWGDLAFGSQAFGAAGGPAPYVGQQISFLVDDGDPGTARLDEAWHQPGGGSGSASS